jgi:hypothetical protein
VSFRKEDLCPSSREYNNSFIAWPGTCSVSKKVGFAPDGLFYETLTGKKSEINLTRFAKIDKKEMGTPIRGK